MVPGEYYLALAGLVFVIGGIGVLTRRNVIMILMSIELMLNAVNLTFIGFAKIHGNMMGQMFVIFVITVAAVEAAAERANLVDQRNRLITDVNQAELLCLREITDASARGVPLSFLNVAKSLLDNADTNADLAAAGEATNHIVDDVYRFYSPSVRRQRP